VSIFLAPAKSKLKLGLVSPSTNKDPTSFKTASLKAILLCAAVISAVCCFIAFCSVTGVVLSLAS